MRAEEKTVACNNSFREKRERFQVDTQLWSTQRGILCATGTALSHQPTTRIDVGAAVGSEFRLKKGVWKEE